MLNFVNLKLVGRNKKKLWRPSWIYVLLFVNENITIDFIDSTNPDVDIKINLICKAGLKIKPNIDRHAPFWQPLWIYLLS